MNRTKYKELIEKADRMEKNAGLNRGRTPSEVQRIKQMMIGRADALRSKAYQLLEK